MRPDDISDVFCSPLRLSILAGLISRSLLFSELRELTGATDGNLSVQLSKLQKKGMITAHKRIHQNKLVTLYEITPLALREFETYVETLESILRAKDANDRDV